MSNKRQRRRTIIAANRPEIPLQSEVAQSENAALQGNISSQRKAELEVQKLQSEIFNLQFRWWKPAAIQAIPGSLLVLATVAVALFSGLLDAKRDLVSAQNERLEMKKMRLEDEEKRINSEIGLMKEQLAHTKRHLAVFQTERDTLKVLRALRIGSKVDFIADKESYEVTLEPLPLFNFSLIDEPAKKIKAENSEFLLTALASLSKMTNVTSLRIKDLHVGASDLRAIGAFTSLNELVLNNSELTDETMQQFPLLKSLRNIRLINQRFGDPGGLRNYDNLTVVGMQNTPLSDAGLKHIGSLGTTVETLHISETMVTDASAEYLSACAKLAQLDVSGSAMTQLGIRAVSANVRIKAIFTDRKQISEDSTADMRRARQDLVIIRDTIPPVPVSR